MLFLMSAILQTVITIPILIVIESPRYYMIKGKVKEAQEAIWKLAGINNVKTTLKDIIIDEEVHLKDKVATIQQLKEFFAYPVILKETIIQMFCWCLISMCFYGFNFGWQEILPNIYIGYILAAVGEVIAYILGTWLIAYKGRRLSMITFFIGSLLSYLIAIINVNLSDGWTLESVACLIGNSFISTAFSGIYLYTSELAPTSHRGMIFSFCSCAGRIGSFAGPFILTNVRDIIGKGLSFGLLAALSVIAVVGMLYLVETDKLQIPDKPEDVVKRRTHFKLELW